jgi:hypothetical protein
VSDEEGSGMTETSASHQQQLVLLRSHVEKCLKEVFGSGDLVMDEDGDYPFSGAYAPCWVSVVDNDEPFVQIYAHAAHDVPLSQDMLAELTDVNGRAIWAKVSWAEGLVVVHTVLHWTHVDVESLDRTTSAVIAVADDIGPMLTAVHGGHTPLVGEAATGPDDAADHSHHGRDENEETP